jgi:hypothetical protein
VLNPSTLNTSVKQQSKRWDPSTGGIGYGDPDNPYLAKLNDLSDIYKNFFGRTNPSQEGLGISTGEAVGTAAGTYGAEQLGHFLTGKTGVGTVAALGGLGAALYNPVWTSAVQSPVDFAIAATGFVLLIAWRVPPLLVVVLSALTGIGLSFVT